MCGICGIAVGGKKPGPKAEANGATLCISWQLGGGHSGLGGLARDLAGLRLPEHELGLGHITPVSAVLPQDQERQPGARQDRSPGERSKYIFLTQKIFFF